MHRWPIYLFLLVALSASYCYPVRAAEYARVERFLHAGDLARGQQVLEADLLKTPADDQCRFELGVLKFVRGVERLGQSLYEYGARSENAHAPFVRLPVPTNPDPAVIRYATFRRILDDFRRDLDDSEQTLAAVKDDHVALAIRLANIHVDLDGDGKSTDRFLDILSTLMRRDLALLKNNPEFVVKFDRGDVAWMRAYCHLLMGMLDFYLALDLELQFDLAADQLFARTKTSIEGDLAQRWTRYREPALTLKVKEPLRLTRFRNHLLQVAELNRETWRYIRAESDNDYEWLPNPKQTGVLGMPVREDMIDAWLGALAEVESVLNGSKLLPVFWRDAGGKGVNLKRVLDEPPAVININTLFSEGIGDQYVERGPMVNLGALLRVASVFENTTMVAYAAWFN